MQKGSSAGPYATARRVPPGLLLLGKLCLLGFVTLAGAELSWRLVGAQPAPSDLLAFARLLRASQHSPDAVVLTGSSRTLCDLDPKALKSSLAPYNFYQLATTGNSALPILETISRDITFCGQVLSEFHVSYLTDKFPFPETDSRHAYAQQFADFVHHQPYFDFVGTWFMEELSQQSSLLTDAEKDFPLSLDRTFRKRSGVNPPAVHREDRFTSLDMRTRCSPWVKSMADRRNLRTNGETRALDRLVSLVTAIRQRGGDVIFVRMPVTGALKRMENDLYPDQDQVIRSVAARNITVIDFEKEPALNTFDCMDESHLNGDDAARFSAALGRILRERQLLKLPPAICSCRVE